MSDEIRRVVHRCQEARRKGVVWLLSHTNADGSIGPVEQGLFYYRLPWALAVSGETVAAGRLLDWIRHNQFTSDGQLRGVSPLGLYAEHYYTYPLATLIVGAHLRRQYDISHRGLKFLLTWQNPYSGGFYDSVGPIDPYSEEEMCATGQCGLTCLITGNLEAARRTATWFKSVWELQPELPERLYCAYSEATGLITRFPADRAFDSVVEAQGLWQAYYNPGLAAAFLGRMYMATGEGGYLQLARQYQGFSMDTTDRQFESAQVCKSGWGSAVLYEATGEDIYQEWTLRLGEWFIENQLADGHWENTKYWTPNPTTADNIELTAEFVVHLDTIVHALGLSARKESGGIYQA